MREQTAQLGYAPRVPLHQRRQFVKWLLAGSVLLIVASAFKWAPGASDRVQIHYWQQRCLNFVPDFGQRAVELSNRATPPSESITDIPQWTELTRRLHLITSRTCFLGRRYTPSGKERLVSVEIIELDTIHSRRTVNLKRSMLAGRVIAPGSIIRPVREIKTSWDGPFDAWAVDFKKGVIFFGTSDSADPTHFTIPYEIDGVSGVIDGWLRDDDTVVLGERKPVTPPPPASRGSLP